MLVASGTFEIDLVFPLLQLVTTYSAQCPSVKNEKLEYFKIYWTFSL